MSLSLVRHVHERLVKAFIYFVGVATTVSVLLLSDNVDFLKPPDADPWNVRQCQWWKPWNNFVRMLPVCRERA